jgi:hypothetical protein
LATEKVQALEHAIGKKTADILSQAVAEADLRVQALKMPLAELASKGQAFEQALQSIEEQRRITRDLLAGDKRRLLDGLESRIQALREEVSTKLVGVIHQSLTGASPATWERTAQRAVATAMEEVFAATREQLARTFSVEATDVFSAHQRRIDALIGTVRRTAAEIFAVSFQEEIETAPFELGHEPYWVTESMGSTLIPEPSRLIDRVLPPGLRRARLRARIIKATNELIVRNAENLRWAILRGLDETFRKAVAQFEARLDDAISTTKGVIDDVVACRRDRAFVVDPEVERLSRAKRSLEDIFAGLDRALQVSESRTVDTVAGGKE